MTPYQLLDLVALCLASGALANAWLSEGQPFEHKRREWKRLSGTWWKDQAAKLAGCRFCLTHQAALWLGLWVLVVAPVLAAVLAHLSVFLAGPLGPDDPEAVRTGWNATRGTLEAFLKVPVYALAVARVSLAFAAAQDDEQRDGYDEEGEG